jgi:SAM-dependent methyltransferase
MQSAHYIAESDLPLLLRDLAQVLRPGSGRVIFQARNMHPHWWPWRFPKEWTPYVREALKPLYRLADRYERQLRELPQLFANVAVDTLPFRVELPAEDYWRRLEGRFIMPILGAGVLPEQVHKEGLQAMIDRYERAGKRTVDWEERFTVVSAVRT